MKMLGASAVSQSYQVDICHRIKFPLYVSLFSSRGTAEGSD